MGGGEDDHQFSGNWNQQTSPSRFTPLPVEIHGLTGAPRLDLDRCWFNIRMGYRTSPLLSEPDVVMQAPLEVLIRRLRLLISCCWVSKAVVPLSFVIICGPVGLVRCRLRALLLWLPFPFLFPQFLAPVFPFPPVMQPLLDGLELWVLPPKVILPICSSRFSWRPSPWVPRDSCLSILAAWSM